MNPLAPRLRPGVVAVCAAGVLAVGLLAPAGGAIAAEPAQDAGPAQPPADTSSPAPQAPSSSSRPKIGLVLSGGGARGIAHVGVLQVLEERRIPIDVIVGTSMGSIVGGLYATGMSPAEIESEILRMDWYDLFNDKPPRRDLGFRRKEDTAPDFIDVEAGLKRGKVTLPRGLVAGQKINFALQSLTLRAAAIQDFDHLPIPFRAIATDIGSGEMVVLDRGSLADALRASMSIPGVMAPVELDGRLLVDGGLTRNLPVDVARGMGADVIIAVDVSTQLGDPDSIRSLPDVTRQVTGMLTRENVEEQLPHADVTIVPDLGPLTGNDFSKARTFVDCGTTAMRARIDELARYALSPEEFTARLDRLHALPTAPPRIDSVTIEGVSRVDRRIIDTRVQTKAGGPLDLGVLKNDLAHLYELGDFERVEYSLRKTDDSTGLVIRAREKPWGPDYLRFGVNLRNDFEGNTDFSVASRLTATRLDPLGAEWRSDIQFGGMRRLSSEFYQPLDFGGNWFVSPSLDYSNASTDVFDGDSKLAEYRVRIISGALAIGAELGKYGEVKIGVTRGRAHARPDIGAAGLPRFDIPIAAYALRMSIDRLDNPSFPHQGRFGSLDVYLARRSLGSDVSYDRVSGSFGQILGRKRHYVLMTLSGGTNLGSDIPFYDQFPVGGLFSLSGFKDGQLNGQVFGVARLGYYRRSGKLSGLVGRGIYSGGWLEAGNAWATSREASVSDLHYAATLFLGVDTLFGPLYLAYGHADGGHNAFYLSMGRSIGGPRLYGFSHY